MGEKEKAKLWTVERVARGVVSFEIQQWEGGI